jgi:exodeoxyribonuclease VII large subunit
MSQDNNTVLASRTIKDVYAVSRLVRESRAVLEGSFPLVWVEGEISNLAMPNSGHIYFTLKDEIAQVRCAMFRNRNRQLRFTPENGMQVLMRVRVTLYEGRGEFQLVVEHMEEAGSGALQRAYEALKQRLGQEGLFDEALKQSLPKVPSSIGIVSSPNGAAVHDILSVLQRRFPSVNVILYPVAVQGEGSVNQIHSAILTANQRQECDVLIVGRGGGSLEDLWSFNDEKVARAIADSTIPVISAVGHEVDFTIADFVADVRAPTPSAAAELAVPDQLELLAQLSNIERRFNRFMSFKLEQQFKHVAQLLQRIPKPTRQLQFQQTQLNQLKQRLVIGQQRALQNRQQQIDLLMTQLKHPSEQINLKKQTLLALDARLQQAIKNKLTRIRSALSMLEKQRASLRLQAEFAQQKHYVAGLVNRLHSNVKQSLSLQKTQLTQQMRTLSAVSPLSTLERGYSITTNDEDKVIINASDVEQGQTVNVRLHQGQLQCEVKQVKK